VFFGDLLFLLNSSSGAVFSLLLGRYAVMPLAATVRGTRGGAVDYLPLYGRLFLPGAFYQAPVSEILVQALDQGVIFVAMLLYT
jgi:hypothetical protein